MPVPVSGVITFQDIRNEFAPRGWADNLRAYLRGAGIVPNTLTNAAVPASGNLSIRDFRGDSAATSEPDPALALKVVRGPSTVSQPPTYSAGMWQWSVAPGDEIYVTSNRTVTWAVEKVGVSSYGFFEPTSQGPSTFFVVGGWTNSTVPVGGTTLGRIVATTMTGATRTVNIAITWPNG